MSEQKQLAEALLAAQENMPAVEGDGENPHFRSKFVTLGNLLSKVRPVLNKHGLSLVQAPAVEDGQFVLTTTLLHSSGESLTFSAPLAPVKDDPQAQGSAITYMRRYSLAALLAIADQEDDDGNAATAASTSSGGSKVKPSEKQMDFFKSLAEEAGFTGDDLGLVTAWAKQTLSGGRGGSLSKAIDGLKDKAKRSETADRLGKAAKKWAEESAVEELQSGFDAEPVA